MGLKGAKPCQKYFMSKFVISNQTRVSIYLQAASVIPLPMGKCRLLIRTDNASADCACADTYRLAHKAAKVVVNKTLVGVVMDYRGLLTRGMIVG